MKFEKSETKVSTSQNVSTSHNAHPLSAPTPPTFTSFSHLIPFKMRQEFIKFLGILLYENMNLKEHVKYIENKISKNLALLKEARPILEQKCSASSLLLTYTYLLQLCQHSLGRCPQDKFLKSQQSTKTCNMHFE